VSASARAKTDSADLQVKKGSARTSRSREPAIARDKLTARLFATWIAMASPSKALGHDIRSKSMIRNLKVLLVAAMALTALGAIAASAHAADEFHCSVAPCKGTLHTDGTEKTAHHVFILENEATTESVSFTCESLTGEGESATKTFTEITFTNLKYSNCTVNGSIGLTVDTNGCTYTFKAAGGTTDGAKVKVGCPEGKTIDVTYNGCTVHIKGGFESTGVGYHTSGVAPSRELTATVNHVVIPAAQISAVPSKAACLITPDQPLIGTYTTGNTLVTGETPAGVMAEAWYE
jgi:hypothetical protein